MKQAWRNNVNLDGQRGVGNPDTGWPAMADSW
jgi:hypothetical protein